jgi:hypothetical protein
MTQGGSTVAGGERRVTLDRDRAVSFTVNYDPLLDRTYTLTVKVEDRHGQSETHVIALMPAPS